MDTSQDPEAPDGVHPECADPGGAALQLEGFHVRMFRSILDSGFIPVFPLTALVGRQASGKTSLLRAIQGLDAALQEPYVRERDWPRHAHRHSSSKQVVCTASFRFGDASRKRLLGEGTIDSGMEGVQVHRGYEGELLVESWDGRLEQGPLQSAGSPSPRAPALEAFVREHLPPFVFASPESLLPPAIPVGDLQDLSADIDETGTAAFAQLLFSVGHVPRDLTGVEGPRSVRAAGDRIQELLADWGPPPRLSLGLRRGRVEICLLSGRGVRTPIDELPAAERYRLTLLVRMAACRESGRTQPLLLLDAPGSLFRGPRQAQLDHLLDALVDAGAKVLYSARLPFDIDLQYPEQVLVLSRASNGSSVTCPEREARGDLGVRAALGMIGRPSFRIDDLNLVVEGNSDVWIVGALDQLLRRSGEPGLPPDMNLTSAGGSHEVAALVAFLGRHGLAAVGLVDSDDAGVKAETELARFIRSDDRIKRAEIFQLSSTAGLGRSDGTIEDLFPFRFYLDVAREVCGGEAREPLAKVAKGIHEYDQGSNGNISSRLKRAFEEVRLRFPKAQVAKALESRIAAMSSVEELPEGMAASVRRLMEAIRDAADRHRIATSPADDQP